MTRSAAPKTERLKMYEIPPSLLADIKDCEEARRTSHLPWNHPEFPLLYDGLAPKGARCSLCERDLSLEAFDEEDGLFVCHSSEGCDEHSAEEEYMSSSAFEALSFEEAFDLCTGHVRAQVAEGFYFEVVGSEVYSDRGSAERSLPGKVLLAWDSTYAVSQGGVVHVFEVTEEHRVFYAGLLPA